MRTRVGVSMLLLAGSVQGSEPPDNPDTSRPNPTPARPGPKKPPTKGGKPKGPDNTPSPSKPTPVTPKVAQTEALDVSPERARAVVHAAAGYSSSPDAKPVASSALSIERIDELLVKSLSSTVEDRKAAGPVVFHDKASGPPNSLSHIVHDPFDPIHPRFSPSYEPGGEGSS